MDVKHTHEIPAQPVKAGDYTTLQVLIQGPNFTLRRFVIEPGGGMPTHTNTVEHEQYVLRGRASIGVGEAGYEVSQGDVVYIPAGVSHWYQNIGQENFEFLCIVPNQKDEIKILDKGNC